MNALVFDETGSLAEPVLHDAFIYRIDFGGKQVALYCRSPNGETTRIELRGVAHLFSTGLAEQNVLLDVCIEEDDEVCSQALGRILPGAGNYQQKYRAVVLDKLRQKGLKLLRFSPSYGGEIIVLCEEAVYERDQ
ncbi:MAG: hypothetical protein AB1899_18305 [Pseudomonadota bacterium]